MSNKPRSSSAVKVCQVGYLPVETKYAVVTERRTGDVIVRTASDGMAVQTATVAARGLDDDSGDTVWAVDFSDLRQPGSYYLDVSGVGASYEFRVGGDVFVRALRLAMRAYYGQRCGIAVDLAPDFPEYRYPACHTAPAKFHASSGLTGEHACLGGWHDAGDYGRYIVNSGITTGTLLWAYELNEAKLRHVNLDIPESAGPIPDFLAEVRYNIDWMLTMQDGVDGGVWHKATSERFCEFVMPHDDVLPVQIIGSACAPHKTTASTADFAAVCAIACRVYLPFDAPFADRCLAAAKSAWSWLGAHPEDHFFENPEGVGTGGYGNRDLRDERLWAAAELFRTTGEEPYNRYFVNHYTQWAPAIRADEAQSWWDVSHMGMYTYLLSGRGSADAGAVAQIRSDAIIAADCLVARSRVSGYRVPMRACDYIWGSNAVVANYAMMLLIANRVSPNRDYVNSALDCLHYLLGRNTFNTSFVTHLGTNWAVNPHHRPSGADGIDQPWPGMLVGGPNARGKTPPARQWRDDIEEFSLNEIAINWNAPLVFILAEAF